MREGWEIKKLVEVCEFKSGTTISDKLEKSTGNVIYAKVGDMNLLGNEDYMTVSSRYVDLNDINKNQIIPIGSIIFPKRGGAIATNKKRRIIKPTIVDLNTMALIPNKEINKDYLFFWFKQIDLSELSNGTSIPQINNYSFDNVFISYPKSLSEQQSIVSILDEAFAAINQAKANVQRNLQNAKELFQSELNSIFTNKGEGWAEKKLGEVGRFINGRAYSKDELLNKGKYTVLRVGNFFTNKNWYYSNLELEDDKYCDYGDLLYAWSASFGPRIWNGEKVIYHYHIWKVIPNTNTNTNIITKEFLFQLLEWDTEKIKAAHGTGTTMMHVSKGSIENRLVPIPPIKNQLQIVQQLHILQVKTKKLEKLYQHKLNELEGLKKSILQKAFSGELSNKSTVSKQVNIPITISELSVTDLHAGIIALSLKRHEEANAAHTFHHVKSEKIVHLIESHLGIDLNRTPVQDAAGPNDYPLKMKVEYRAKTAAFFYVNESKGIKSYTKGSQFEKLISKINDSLQSNLSEVKKLIDLMIPMNTQQAEIVATVYAAWNNLLLENKDITDETIVTEARENWHENKLKIPREKFFKAITWMSENNLVPKGTGKKVVKKA